MPENLLRSGKRYQSNFDKLSGLVSCTGVGNAATWRWTEVHTSHRLLPNPFDD
jgi:hypothetical protein